MAKRSTKTAEKEAAHVDPQPQATPPTPEPAQPPHDNGSSGAAKVLRTLAVVLGVVGAIVVILGVAWLFYSRRSFPQTTGTVSLDGLSQPVEVYRDANGIAHIYAHTTEDLFFAQGYVHAQERFWEMEFQRRVGSGRLSEIIGDATLDTDIYLRTMGFRHLAEQEYDDLSPDNKKVLDSYAAGVNAYILNRAPEDLGLEFALFKLQGVDIPIEPWSGVDSLVWVHMMIYDQSDKMRVETRNMDILRAVGSDMQMQMRPPYRDGRPVIVPDDENLATPGTHRPSANAAYDADTLALLTSLSPAFASALPDAAPGYYTGIRAGSNSWVISGDHTDTGKPLMANDPHMGIQIPSIWYQVDMHCVEKSAECPYELQGFSLVGIPGILLGHNDQISWALTNASFDAQDMFIERINPENINQYEVNGDWQDMTIRYETIKIEGQADPYILPVRSTRHGPLVSDRLRTEQNAYLVALERDVILGMSLQWTGLRPIRSMEAIMEVNRAQNFDEFRAALQKFDAGTQNFLYADVNGNIGYQLPGLIPIRARGDGSLPVPGWADDYEWTGYIPYDELPYSYNPDKGFIVTANQPQVTDSYPYLLATDIDYGYRSARLVDMVNDVLDGGGKFTIDDIKLMQRDNKSLPALEMIPSLNGLTFEDPAVTAARDRLLDWDGQMNPDSPEAALYNYFWVELMKAAFDDQLPPEIPASGSGRNSETIYHMLQDDNDPWWDDSRTPGGRETRDEILARAFAAGYEAGKADQGDDWTKWTWGKMHTMTMVQNPLGQSGIGLIEDIFNRGPFPVSGSEAVVNKISWSTVDGFEASSAPALRAIYDLSNFAN